MKKIFKLILFFVIFFLPFLFNKSILAADFKTNYQVNYNLTHFQENLTANVNFKITITNLKSEVYVNKYSISFPKSFAISNLQSSDDHGEINPKITSDDFNTKVEMEFSNPNLGKDSVNTFYLTFNQTNLFKVNGNVWEVALPVIENKQNEDYQVIVTLPINSDKKLSISKPNPSSISGNQIIWINPKTKIIYAVFGDKQIYETELVYHLKNTEVYPVITEIALPPDTLYQKIFLNNLKPNPFSVYQDEDGNYLAKYKLNPLESKIVTFKGFIEVVTKPRDELLPLIREQINKQKNYLISQQKYWNISKLEKISLLTDSRSIYNFVVSNLSYNYNKIDNNNRLGADEVLANPSQAVCLEFSDLFVGISREKGILSREVQGYGFSYDPQLQPLSLVSDVLHSWPEFYDKKAELWIPVDPTWENTSGIDYYSSFDLNHITFVIHGKKPNYPVPAGMYKVGDSKDISIKAVVTVPEEQVKFNLTEIDIPLRIIEKKEYQGKVKIKNESNVYLRNIPVKIEYKNITVKNSNTKIKSLAPFEEKELDFKFQLDPNHKDNKANIDIYVFDKKIDSQLIEIIPHYYLLVIAIIGAFLFIGILVLMVKKIKIKKRKNDN